MRGGARWLGVAAVLGLVGCAGLQGALDGAGLGRPGVQLDAVRLSGLDSEGLELSLALAVDNPNPVSVRLAGYSYAVAVEGRQLVAGEGREALEVPARGSGRVRVPVRVRFDDLYRIAAGLRDAASFPYRAEVTARVAVPVLGEVAVPVQASGTLPIPRVPDVSVAGVRVRRLGLGGADLVVDLAVKNPNAFAVDVSRLAYRLEVAGAPWLDGALPRALHLPEAGGAAVEIPVRVDLLGAGAAVARALAGGGEIAYRLRGEAAFDTGLALLRGVTLPFDRGGSAPTLR